MKNINKKILVVLIFATVGMSACKKDFLDVNNDPNRVTENNVTPELIFPAAQTGVGNRQASANFRFLNNWMGYTAASGTFAIDQTETSYNIDFGFGDAMWQNYYNVLFDLHQVETKALAKNDKVLAGAAIILSSKLFQELADIYGNIPYTQAFDIKKYPLPVYDKGVDIYGSLQKRLDTAIGYMGQTAQSSFKSIDLINTGNQTKWIKFGNTLKLRLLIRQSEVSGFNPSSEITKIAISGVLNILHQGETVSVNPGYVNEVNKQSPFYANYGFDATGNDANTVTRASNYFKNLLNGTNDPRLTRFYQGPVVGNDYGLSAGNPLVSSKLGPGLLQGPTQDQWIFTSFESMFLEAEAIARGWTPGSAQTAYEAAVTESFVWLGVPDAVTAAADYLTSVAIADWSNAGGTASSKAKFITYQKYIALCGTDPLEAWSDLRRLNMIPGTGYISVNPSRLSNALPVRLLYPQSEYTTNGANANSQGTINQFTSKIFWQP